MVKISENDVLVRRIEAKLNKGIARYGLIDDGDNILIGLSGGKDSMALLELLARRARIFKPRFSVEAVHVVMSNIGYRSDVAYLRDFCEGLGVPFHVVETSFDKSDDSRKPYCFLCSWYRRKSMFALARRLGCNKIALGHHADDIIETLLLNMTFPGRLDTMRPLQRMDRFAMTIVRPLCLVAEADLASFARMRGFREQLSRCPYETDTRRADMRRVFRELQSVNPEARYSLWRCAESTFARSSHDSGE